MSCKSEIGNKQKLEDCAQFAKFYACKTGLLVGAGKGLPKDFTITHAPFALFPQNFPKKAFWQVQYIMPVLNTLMDKVSQDQAFLMDTLKVAAQYDDFTQKLINIYLQKQDKRSQSKAQDQEITLGLFRSDYMYDQFLKQILQIEFNTISVSFLGLSKRTTEVQQKVLDLYPQLYHKYLDQTSQSKGESKQQSSVINSIGRQEYNLGENLSTELAIEGIYKAVQVYEQQYSEQATNVLLIVDENENNAFDQELVVQGVFIEHQVPYIRASLEQIFSNSRHSYEETTGILRVDGQVISVVYFRSAYTPHQLQSENQWSMRRIIEFSNAVKCPNIEYQLAGTKKVQQQLAKAGVLEQFVQNKEEVDAIRSVFTDLYSLEYADDNLTQKIIKEAIQSPENYVLKPQREGGGNNLYNEELKEFLIQGKNLGAYILMHKIKPEIKQSYLLRRGEVISAEVISELGIYGAIIRQGQNIIFNKQQGSLLRTKVATSDEGGVAAGYAVLDSIREV